MCISLYTFSLGLDPPCCPKYTHPVLTPAQPWTCKRCRTKRALAYRLTPIPIQKSMQTPRLQIFNMHSKLFTRCFTRYFTM